MLNKYLHYKQNKIALSSFPGRDGLITRRVQQDSFNHEGQCRAVQIQTIESHVQGQTIRLHVQVQTMDRMSYAQPRIKIRFTESCKTQGFPRFPVT
jgi:hypothetical protein